MKYAKLNKRLLNRVLRHIKAEPRRFSMSTFCQESDAAPCGTQACIGGWAYLLSVPKKQWERAKRGKVNFQKVLIPLLGLTDPEYRSLCLTLTHQSGKRGVRIAERKINLLKTDREKFIREYPYCGCKWRN